MDYFSPVTSNKGPAFCPHCHTLLTLPEINSIVCDNCGFRCKYEDLSKLEVVTHSATKPLQPWVSKPAEASEAAERARAIVEEDCPECGHKGLLFYTMQLRSADEGSTVFYECPECNHKFSQNN